MQILLHFFLFLCLYEICHAQTNTTHHTLQIGSSTLDFEHSLALQFPTPFRLYWTATPQSPNATFGVLAQTVAQDGYVAVGFSKEGKMVGSRAIIGISSSTSSKPSAMNDVKITARALYGLNSSHPVTFNHQIQYNSDGTMAMAFSIPLAAASLSFNESCGIVYAIGHATTSGMIEKHTQSHSARIMLSGAAEYDNDRAVKVAVHAALMVLAWMILAPLAAFFAAPQFRRRLFRDKSSNPKYIGAHRLVITAAVIAASIGFFIGVFVIGTRTFMVHFALGISVFGVMLIQATLGFWRTTIYPHRRSEFRAKGVEKVGKENRHLITFIHSWLGRLLYAMAVVNIVFGQLAYQDYGTVGLVATGVLAAVGCALFLAGPVSTIITRGE